ncbi:hypothetical protein ZIOFF_005072 [Zingiber officinale]|uniref:Exocyst complex component SEC5 n=1 Tax=Zingiber officinale TaxID=94328 RepID=A0A8J5M437_ZINOF|nr:hypothetical protein ZIOFF_005072 [Zingiber officinale]
MSDSDLDEDELLQIALREQSERDVNYKRPSAKNSKPVVNLVRPPPPPHFMDQSQPHRNVNSNSNHRGKQSPPQQQKQRRKPSRGGDDDDESEVEMLSISSGDEDSSKDRVPPQRGRGGSDRRALRDDGDVGQDDDEPRSWKRVDEAELARRVREMRETRAAPSTQEQKTSTMAHKGLAHMQSLPRGVEVLDPLGLGVIDNKSLRLITDASVSSPISREKVEPLDPSIREKLTYSSPNFDPKIFLSRVHQDTSAANLEAGALTLKTDLKGRTQQKKQLVKENFDCFISCKTTIDDIQSKLTQIEEDPEGAGTARLYESTQNISQVANRAFQPLFERQAQAEKIRSVQGMLQRFRTLFNLPSTIRGSIAKGEYDLAVREYRKAKSIVLPSHVGILKRVLEEVEKVMQEFRMMLFKSMEDPELDLADLENIVRLLLELEPSSDPVWRYLNIQNRRIKSLLEKCTSNHEAQMEMLHNKIRDRSKSDARWRQLQEDSTKLLDSESSLEYSSEMESHLIREEMDILRRRYINMLNTVVIHHIPPFWRLALSVFSGKFAKVTPGGRVLDTDTSFKPPSSKNEEKDGDIKYSTHALEEVTLMLHGTISAFEAKLDSESSLEYSSEMESHLIREEMDILRGRYINMLNTVVIHHIPPFWRLALSVFSGKFAKVTPGGRVLDTDTSFKPPSSKNEEKDGDIKYSTHALEEVTLMLHGTISAFEAKVQSTFRDFDESNILRSFMNDAIVEIAKTCQALEGKESAPPAAVRALHGLYFDITKIYILRLCTWMRATTKEISPDEMWSPLTTLERNKSPYTISCLPLVFQSTIISAMDRIDNLIESLKNETIKYQHVSEHIQEIQESVRLAFLNSFLGFAGYLERIGSELSQWISNKENNPLQNGYLHNIEKELSTSDGGCAAPLSDFHRKLLIVLSNIGYCKDELSHGLYCRYKHVWLQHRDDDEQNADMRDLVTSFSALEEKVLGQYTCAKSDLIRDAAQIYLFGSGIQWGGAPTVKGIRDATVDLLHILVGVHAEVQQCSCYTCL